MKKQDDGDVRFWVEGDYISEPDESIESYYPENHEEALKLFDYLSSKYHCVWLAEYGRYKAGSETKDGWIYYKWTERTEWGEYKGRFTGYPETDTYELVDYTAINRDGSRVAGV